MKTLIGIVLAAYLSTGAMAQQSNPPIYNERGEFDPLYDPGHSDRWEVVSDTLPMTFENLFKVDEEEHMALGLAFAHQMSERYGGCRDSVASEDDRPYFGAAEMLYLAKCSNLTQDILHTDQYMTAAGKYMLLLDPRTSTLQLLDEARTYLRAGNHEKVDEVLYSAERQWFVLRNSMGVFDSIIVEERVEIR